jgi:hypothetical protein
MSIWPGYPVLSDRWRTTGFINPAHHALGSSIDPAAHRSPRIVSPAATPWPTLMVWSSRTLPMPRLEQVDPVVDRNLCCSVALSLEID